jgi:c(7)-type cytochrome triheme protein
MSSCDTCHQPGRPNWTSASSRAFRVSFSHSRHTQGARISCTACHSIKAGAPRGRQVSEPLVSMHFAPVRSLSCGGCHNGSKAFGPNDFSNCKRCHKGNSFGF